MKEVMLRSRTGNSNEGVNNHSENVCRTVKPTSYPSRKFATAHLHELITKLISESSLSEKNEANDHKDKPDSDSTFLVNSTSTNSINPGDIIKLMSIPDEDKAISNKKQAAFSNEVTMNGKTYRDFSQHVIY